MAAEYRLPLSYIDVKRDFGASGSSASTTGTISAGSNVLTLASAIDFKNGQGIAVVNAGPLPTISVPSSATATPTGTAGTTTITYAVAALDGAGGVTASFSFSTTTANATLSATNYVALSVTAVTSATGYAWWRTSTNGTSPTTTGFIGWTSGTTLDDTGISVHTPPIVTGITSTAPSSATADTLVTTVASGGGTSVITLSGSATNAASSKLTLHDDTVSISNAVAYITGKNGGTLYFPQGEYAITSNITTGANTTIVGAGWSSTQANPAVSSVLRLSNNCTFALGGPFCSIDNMQVDGSTNTGAGDILAIAGDNPHIGRLFVWGSPTACGVHFAGTSSSGIADGTVDLLVVEEGCPAILLTYTTQCHFGLLNSVAAYNQGVVLDNSDNNSFSHLHITNMNGSNSTLLTIGTSSSSQSYGERIDYADLTGASGFTAIEVNYMPNILGAEDINSIGHLHVEGSVTEFAFNNSSYGSLRVGMMDRLSVGWATPTPSLPAAIGSANAVQNTNPYSVEIYQSGGIGTHIVDMRTLDNGVPDQPVIRLDPGDKVYFATTIPSSWRWKGL